MPSSVGYSRPNNVIPKLIVMDWGHRRRERRFGRSPGGGTSGCRELHGDKHLTTLGVVNSLTMLRRVGLMTQDDSSKRPWLVTGGAWIQGTLNSITNLAVFLKDKGQLDEAEPLFLLLDKRQDPMYPSSNTVYRCLR